MTIINTNSPLRLDGPMSDGLIEMAIHGQPVVATPFTLAGAMSPATLAGAIAQQNAEALFMVALTQLARPGVPVVYGGFTSNVDMRTGSPAFGTPEFVKAAFATGQMARRYGLPWRSSNATASNVVDAQAAYESQMAIWGAVMGGVSLLYQGAGWLEGGLTASFEKLIGDAEMLQMMAEVLVPFTVDDAEIGLEVMAEVGPGGHHFATSHTLERSEHAFYRRILSTGGTSRRGMTTARARQRSGRAGSAGSWSPTTSRHRWSLPPPRRSMRSWQGGGGRSRRRASRAPTSASSSSPRAGRPGP
jgi:trimethylamine--corrinoid protein Co-methyltransferase